MKRKKQRIIQINIKLVNQLQAYSLCLKANNKIKNNLLIKMMTKFPKNQINAKFRNQFKLQRALTNNNDFIF